MRKEKKDKVSSISGLVTQDAEKTGQQHKQQRNRAINPRGQLRHVCISSLSSREQELSPAPVFLLLTWFFLPSVTIPEDLLSISKYRD